MAKDGNNASQGTDGSPTAAVTIGIVSDIHNGDRREAKDGTAAIQLLEDALSMLDAAGCDLILNLGDCISEMSFDEDRKHMREVSACFMKCKTPYIYVPGNHDQEHLDRKQLEDMWQGRIAPAVQRIGAYRIIAWDADSRLKANGLRVPEDRLLWLAGELARELSPAMVCTHVPFSDGSMAGNYYFEGKPPGRAGYDNALAVRKVITRSEKVILCLAGHVHWNSLNTLDGKPYLTVQSLTDLATTHPYASASWATLRIEPENATLSVRGNDPLDVKVPLRDPSYHWLPLQTPLEEPPSGAAIS